jgi:hypothetical protein
VFVNWERLHWGQLGDLIQPNEFWRDNSDDAEELQEHTFELRRELKTFEKRFNLKIVWRKLDKYKDCPDVTDEFIEYWSQGISQRKSQGAITLASLRSNSLNVPSGKGRAR